ncbi:MAG: hypothetical protein JF588_11490 [Caulobacterales bacterium]|nr:hypothetical protein [Caulobacterales bacterium]
MLSAVFRGLRERAVRRHNELLFLAWHCEAFARTKRLPDLGEITRRNAGEEDRPAQSVDEIEAALDRLVERGFAIRIDGEPGGASDHEEGSDE